MIQKVAVSVISTLIFIFTSFCLAEAQQTTKATPRIGLISSTGAPGSSSPLFDAFRLGLRDLGYVDGKNVLIERRYAEGRLDRHPGRFSNMLATVESFNVPGKGVPKFPAKSPAVGTGTCCETIPLTMRRPS